MTYAIDSPIGHIGDRDVWLAEIYISILVIVRIIALILSLYLRFSKPKSLPTSPSPSSKNKDTRRENITKTTAILNNIFVVGTCFVLIWYFHPGGATSVQINGVQKRVFFMLALFILIPYIIDEVSLFTNKS